MKKILSFLLALSMFVSYGGASYAAENIQDNKDVVEHLEIEKELLELESVNGNNLEVQPMALPLAPIVLNTVLQFLVRGTLKEAGEKFGKKIVIKLLGKSVKQYSDIWKGFKNYRGSIKTNGKSGSSKRYYEWDYTHQDIEVYNSKGKHLGSMDPFDGTMYKGPVNGRTIKL